MVSASGRAGVTPAGWEGPEVSPGKGAGRVPRRGWSGREPWDEPQGETHLPCSAGAPGPLGKHLLPGLAASSVQEYGAVGTVVRGPFTVVGAWSQS